MKPVTDVNVVCMEHDGMRVIAYADAVANGEQIVGVYIDRTGMPRRILSRSLYGELIKNALNDTGKESTVETS